MAFCSGPLRLPPWPVLGSKRFDRASGRAIYAMVAFGGLLGMGEKHHPIPWSKLTYDPAREVYVVDLDTTTLDDAPSVGARDSDAWSAEFGERVDLYYRVPSMWVPRS